MNHEGSWLGIFQPNREESTYLKKKKKKEQRMRQPKRSSKKVSLETLEKGIKNQPLGPPKEEGQLGIF